MITRVTRRLVRGMGSCALQFTYVNPADDPSKK